MSIILNIGQAQATAYHGEYLKLVQLDDIIKIYQELSAYCASKFGLLGLAESIAQELNACNNNIRVLTIFLGEVATKMWEEYDFSFYQKNKSKMLQPKDVAVKISEMIFDAKTYKNGHSIEMYSNNI